MIITQLPIITNTNFYKQKKCNLSYNCIFTGLKQDCFESTIPVVSRVSPKELKQIYPLYVKYRASAGVNSSIKEVSKYLSAETKRGEDAIFAAKIADKPVAFLQLGKEYSTLRNDFRYRIKALFVDDEYRGKGVAKALVNHIKNYADDKEIIVKARRTNEHSPFLYQNTEFKEDEKYIHFVYKKNNS